MIFADSSLSIWTTSVSDGVRQAVNTVIAGVPAAIAAIVVLVIGVIVGYILKEIVVRVLRAIKLGQLAQRTRLTTVFAGKYDWAELIGDLVKWFFIIVFLLQALAIAHLEQISDIVNRLLRYLPNVFVAAVVVFVGIVIADLTARVVRDALRVAGASTAKMASNVSRWAILTLVSFTALAQLGVNTLFFAQLFTGIVAALAIAAGLAFGLGGKDAAKDWIDHVSKGLKRD